MIRRLRFRSPFPRRSPRRAVPLVLVVALLAAVLLAWSAPLSGRPHPRVAATRPPRVCEVATCGRVVDGDTLELVDGRRVRYLGIDAPERGRPGAAEATARNRTLIEGRELRLEQEADGEDRYGRLLRHVWVEVDSELVLVGRTLVEEGLAKASPYPPNLWRAAELNEAEEQARACRRGLWASCPDEPYYLATGEVFHRPSCSHVSDRAGARRLATREEATRAQLRPARCCGP